MNKKLLIVLAVIIMLVLPIKLNADSSSINNMKNEIEEKKQKANAYLILEVYYNIVASNHKYETASKHAKGVADDNSSYFPNFNKSLEYLKEVADMGGDSLYYSDIPRSYCPIIANEITVEYEDPDDPRKQGDSSGEYDCKSKVMALRGKYIEKYDGYAEAMISDIKKLEQSIKEAEGKAATSASSSKNEEENEEENENDILIDHDDFCGQLAGVWTIGGYVLFMTKIVVPLLLIIMSMVELTKAITADKDTNPFSLIKNKIIAAVAVFLVAQLVTIVLGVIGSDTDWASCAKCTAHPFSDGCSLLRVKQEHDGSNYYTAVDYIKEKYGSFYRGELSENENQAFIKSLSVIFNDDDKLQEVLDATNADVQYLEEAYYQTKCYDSQTLVLNGNTWECENKEGSRVYVAKTKGKSNSSSVAVDYIVDWYWDFMEGTLSDEQLIKYVSYLEEAHSQGLFKEIRKRAEGSSAIIYPDKLEEALAENICKVNLLKYGKINGYKETKVIKDVSDKGVYWYCQDENGQRRGFLQSKYQDE